MREHLESLIQDIEMSHTTVPAKYIVELSKYPGAAIKLRGIDWEEGDIRIKADILAVAREVLQNVQ